MDRYDTGVKYVDDCLGQLMDALRLSGLGNNTVVVVTSDHGESLGQHYLMTHGRALYWELIHVPLVLWYPGHLPAGEKVSQPVSNTAIPATILELLGTDRGSFLGPGLQGFLRPPQLGKAQDPVSELAQNKYPGKHDDKADNLIPTAKTGSMRSVVTSQWQVISHSTLGEQLYDWTEDPSELRDLAPTAQGQDILRGLAPQFQSLSRR
jgi:arylsulfatase A-like enzyme